jgi:hypothetical protein
MPRCGFGHDIDDGLTDERIFDAGKGSIQAQPLVDHRLMALSSFNLPSLGQMFSVRGA